MATDCLKLNQVLCLCEHPKYTAEKVVQLFFGLLLLIMWSVVGSQRQRRDLQYVNPFSGSVSVSPLLMCLAGQSDTDTSNSITSQDSRQGEPLAVEPVVKVTPDLLTAHCGLLTNLLAILPDFTLIAIRHNQLLQALAR